MRGKQKFIEMYRLMPRQARSVLIFNPYETQIHTEPMSIEVCALEIINDTELGNKILVWLGFEDD